MHEKMSKVKHTIRIVLVSITLLVFMCSALILFSCSAVLHKVELPVLYGALDDVGAYDSDILAPGIMNAIKSHLLTDVEVTINASNNNISKTTVTLLASVYETPEKRGESGKKSTLFNASDQIFYGRALVAMRRKSAFRKWMKDFDIAYWRSDSSFHDTWLRIEETDPFDAATVSSPVLVRGEASWAVTLAYTRALLEAWRLWGGREIERAIVKASDALWQVFDEMKTDQSLRAGAQLPLALDVWEEPWPLPDEDIVTQGTLLSEIDLWALLALSRFEPKWASIASHWINVTRNARLEGELPLMAPAVCATTQYYMALRDGERTLFLREQLIMALHLAEVNITDDAFLSMIRSSLRDYKRLPVGWNMLNNAPLTTEATPSDYALVMCYGRAVGDQQLIEDAKEALLRFRVVSQSSVIFGGFYRVGSTPYTSTLTALDNTSAVLAFR